VALQQSRQRHDQGADGGATQRHARRDADEAVRLAASTEGLSEKRTKVANVLGDDGAALIARRRKLDAVRPGDEIGPFLNCDDVMPAISEAAGDFRREMLIEQQPHKPRISRDACHFASSRSLTAKTRASQSSISSRFDP